MFDQSEIAHATDISYPKPQVHAQHPFKNPDNHEKLIQYCRARLQSGRQIRDSNIQRYAQIDRDVSGWIQLSTEDKKRQRAQAETGIPSATAINLPLNFIHLDDMMSYYAGVFAPNRGMFYHTGKPEEQEPSNQIVTLMNNHAIYGGYYRQTMRTIFSILKYNLGGVYCRWAEDYGPKIQIQQSGELDVQDEVIWEGNRVNSLDMYNTLYDPTVDPVNLHRDGEWAAQVTMKSHYWLSSRASNGVYFNCEKALNDQSNGGAVTTQYYRNPPQYSNIAADESTSSTNWIAIMSEAPSFYQANGFEMVELLIRINPNNFGLIAGNPAKRNRFEVWRITIINDAWIAEATFMPNAHGQIPFYFGLANDDIMSTAAKSPAELIQPLANFASHLLNTHVAANRKKLWGITWYDPTVVDYDKVPDGEVVAQLPIEASGYGKEIEKSIYHDNESLETHQTMQDLDTLFTIIEKFFPSQSLPSQIANIDRAVDSQVAAVQQGANQRNHKTATLLDDSLFRPMRSCMYYNILQFQKDGTVVTDFAGGGTLTINLDQLRQTDLPFIIGQGLKALDRMMIMGRLQQVIFAILQSNQAQEVDVLDMINYWTNMMDIDMDFNQFRMTPEKLALKQQAVAASKGEPPQQPGTNPITPIVNPAAVTEPMQG